VDEDRRIKTGDDGIAAKLSLSPMRLQLPLSGHIDPNEITTANGHNRKVVILEAKISLWNMKE